MAYIWKFCYNDQEITMEEFKLTDAEKLMLIDEMLQQLSQVRHGLQVVRSDEVLLGKTTHSNIHTYQVLGSDAVRKTQTYNLIQKVEEAHKLHPQPLPSMDIEEEQCGGQTEKQANLFRYFKNNVRCFRCKKIGHHNYACLDQMCCQYCLSGEHVTQRCPQKTVCYQCYQYGHVINECSLPVGQFCQECKRKHHKKCCFLTKGIQPIKQMFNTDYLYNNEQIRCMRCLQYGHLICSAPRSQDLPQMQK